MMLLRDFREPAQPFCSDRRSNYDRSRGAVSRFLADSSPRLAHSTAHKQIAGREACHSPRRISCGAPLCAEDIGDCCAFSSPVGLAWVVVGEQPLLAAGDLGFALVRLILLATPIFGRRQSGEFTKCPSK